MAAPTTFSITTGTIVRGVLLVAGALLLFVLRDLVLLVVTAVVIASAIEPGVTALLRRKFSRTFAVVTIYATLLASVGIFVFLFLPSLFADFSIFLGSMPSYLESLNRGGALDQYAQIFGVEQPVLSSSADVLQATREAFNLGAFDSAVSVIARVFGGLASGVLIFVLSFYFALVETGVDDFLRVVTPKKHLSYVLGLWRRSQRKIGLWMQGQLLLAVIIGVIVYLGLMILSVPHALVLAVIAGLFEIIPVFGPVLSAIPAVAIATVEGGVTLGVLVIALFVIAQQFENHLIYPLVVTRVVGVPPILVIISLIAGAQLAGFLGILLSVPVAAIIQELVNDRESGRLAAEAKRTSGAQESAA